MPKNTRHARPTPSRSPERRATIPALNRLWMGITAAILMFCGLTGFLITLGVALLIGHSVEAKSEVLDTNRPAYTTSPLGAQAAASPLSPAFTPEVQYWAPLIQAWGVLYQIDPNLIATVIQIESCGDLLISSPAGAQGLFQVMPFHFDQGEDMLDVQTNARRGLDYLSGGLDMADGHVGLALAGYNGGHGMISQGWGAWADETRRYYYWGSRIYAEVVSGMTTSPTLTEWLNTGGSNLCARASATQQQLEAQKQQQAQARLVSNP